MFFYMFLFSLQTFKFNLITQEMVLKKKKPNMENLWCKHRCEILPVREPHRLHRLVQYRPEGALTTKEECGLPLPSSCSCSAIFPLLGPPQASVLQVTSHLHIYMEQTPISAYFAKGMHSGNFIWRFKKKKQIQLQIYVHCRKATLYKK